MPEITHRSIRTNGINLHIAEAGAGPLVLLVHGFPELWYSWRHQLPALAAAGYHAVAADVRGYGRSDAPAPIDAYSMKTITADFTGLLDALGERTAVIVGHDWGSAIAWASAALHPDRYRAVVGMSVPYAPPGPISVTTAMKQIFQDRFFYILYFQEPGVAEAELERDVAATFMYMLATAPDPDAFAASPVDQKTLFEGAPVPQTLPAWLTRQDVDYFAGEFNRTGFRGGLNKYRNLDRDWEELPQLSTVKITQPALFLIGDRDPTMGFLNTGAMKEFVPNLRGTITLAGAGHWIQQERPAEVNAALLEFLAGL